MPGDTPTRSSLLFSPVAEDSRKPKYADIAAASSLFADDQSVKKSSSSSVEDNTAASLFKPSTSLGESSISGHAQRKSISQGEGGASLLMNAGNATTGHLPLSSNAYNSHPSTGTTSATFSTAPPVPPRLSNFPNASHPVIIGAPIPATRFDTVTSYVDVIYQQQQQQQQQSQQNGLNRTNSQDFTDSDVVPEESGDAGVVLLSPSDGIDGDNSFMATCPKCAMMVMTETEPIVGKKSYQMACLFSAFLMCWAPLYWDSFARKWKDVEHYCPKCRSLIAVYRK